MIAFAVGCETKFPPDRELRRRTHLEDIGDGDGVLGGLALGGDDGDGRPRHGVCVGVAAVSIAGDREVPGRN